MAQMTTEGPEQRAESTFYFPIFNFSTVGTAAGLPAKKSLTNPVKGLAPSPIDCCRFSETMSPKVLWGMEWDYGALPCSKLAHSPAVVSHALATVTPTPSSAWVLVARWGCRPTTVLSRDRAGTSLAQQPFPYGLGLPTTILPWPLGIFCSEAHTGFGWESQDP